MDGLGAGGGSRHSKSKGSAMDSSMAVGFLLSSACRVSDVAVSGFDSAPITLFPKKPSEKRFV